MSVFILLFTCIVSNVKIIQSSKMDGHVVGGHYSNIKDFPHSALLSITCSGRTANCGASIINQELLLTAAHCVYNCQYRKFDILTFTGSVVRYKGEKSKVMSFNIHEQYDAFSNENDIALLRLNDDLTFGTKVQRVVLMKNPPNYKYGVIAGWGWIDSKGTRSNYLKHVRQEFLGPETCWYELGPRPLPVGTICGREIKGESYPEKGDSGSALVAKKFVQIGLVSFKRIALSNETIVYAYIPFYYDWIVENAARLTCDDDYYVVK